MSSRDIITKIEDYEKDIKLSLTQIEFDKKLIDIINFISLEPSLSQEYDNRLSYFDNLIYHNSYFIDLINKLKKKTIDYFSSFRLDDIDDFSEILDGHFSIYSYYSSPERNYKGSYKANNYEEFLKVLNNDDMWNLSSNSYQLNFDFSEKNWDGVIGINYGYMLMEYMLLSQMVIPSKDEEFKGLLDEYNKLTITIPKKLSVRKFQYIQRYYEILESNNKGYAPSPYPEPVVEKENYLIDVIRELKYYLLKLSSEKALAIKPQDQSKSELQEKLKQCIENNGSKEYFEKVVSILELLETDHPNHYTGLKSTLDSNLAGYYLTTDATPEQTVSLILQAYKIQKPFTELISECLSIYGRIDFNEIYNYTKNILEKASIEEQSKRLFESKQQTKLKSQSPLSDIEIAKNNYILGKRRERKEAILKQLEEKDIPSDYELAMQAMNEIKNGALNNLISEKISNKTESQKNIKNFKKPVLKNIKDEIRNVEDFLINNDHLHLTPNEVFVLNELINGNNIDKVKNRNYVKDINKKCNKLIGFNLIEGKYKKPYYIDEEKFNIKDSL